MAAARICLKFASFLVLLALIKSRKVDQSTEVDQTGFSEERSAQLSDTVQQNSEPGIWTVYEPKDFQKNELCNVLNCRRHELCLVRHNNAICVKKMKLDEVEGTKTYFKSPTGNSADGKPQKIGQSREFAESEKRPSHTINEAEQNSVDDQEWDHQKFREKMASHNQKLKNKRKNKAKASIANEVNGELNESHERHTQKMGDYEECTDQQLVAIEARLVQWFSDIHAQQPGETNVPLPKHKVSCREDVGWFFTQLDGDNNGKLEVDELNSLDHDPYEKCIKPFLDRCDINGNDVISLNEWCDCFQWSGHEREEPPCHSARRKHDPHLLGSFLPQCDIEGYYRPEQCHEGFCWCVDKWGREFDKSRTKGRPDCGQYAEAETETDDDEDL